MEHGIGCSLAAIFTGLVAAGLLILIKTKERPLSRSFKDQPRSCYSCLDEGESCLSCPQERRHQVLPAQIEALGGGPDA